MSVITPDVDRALSPEEIQREWDKIYDFAGSAANRGHVEVDVVTDDPEMGVYKVVHLHEASVDPKAFHDAVESGKLSGAGGDLEIVDAA